MSSENIPLFFRGLLELLLHMSPQVAGAVLIPGTLALIGSSVYVRQRMPGNGAWWRERQGRLIVTVAALYTIGLEIGLILLDEFLHVTGMPEGSHGIGPFTTWLLADKVLSVSSNQVRWVGETWIPLALMVAMPWVLVAVLRRRLKLELRGVTLALGAFHLTSMLVLTVVGAVFRGPTFHLMWPW
jgi:hypothetical protein